MPHQLDAIPGQLAHTLDLLARSMADGLLAWQEYSDTLACHLRRQLCCSTVELWRVAVLHGRRTLVRMGHCRADAVGGPPLRVPPGAALDLYLAQVRALNVYACNDSQGDPLGRALACGDAPSDQPGAFMDAMLVLNAQAIGVLSCHHDCGPRLWASEERALLRRLAARVALHLARIDLHRCEVDHTAAPRHALPLAAVPEFPMPAAHRAPLTPATPWR